LKGAINLEEEATGAGGGGGASWRNAAFFETGWGKFGKEGGAGNGLVT
jgi:hypothetical protein